MKIRNLTGHRIVIVNDDLTISDLQPENEARIISIQAVIDWDGKGVPTIRQQFDIERLPDPEPDTIFIVSPIVSAVIGKERPDIVALNMAEAKRICQGPVIFVPGFVGFSKLKE